MLNLQKLYKSLPSHDPKTRQLLPSLIDSQYSFQLHHHEKTKKSNSRIKSPIILEVKIFVILNRQFLNNIYS